MPDRDTTFEMLAQEWREIQLPAWSPEGASERYWALQREYIGLVGAGKWVSGRADLMGVLRRDSKELDHSAAVGWLLTPTGRHGMGARFLVAVLNRVWPEDDWRAARGISVSLEEERQLTASETAWQARADIVLRHPHATVVIENKVAAPEGALQCERLYQVWASDEDEIRWLFLTPSGRPPVTASSPEARSAWRTLSYFDLADLLDTALRSAAPGLGRESASQYLATLRYRYPRRTQ